MKIFRPAVAMAIATVAIGAGTAAVATLANADPYYHPDCRPTSPGVTVGSGRYGSEYTERGTLVQRIYGTGPAGYGVVNCRYQGDLYQFVAGSGSTKIGTTRWLDPRQLYNAG